MFSTFYGLWSSGIRGMKFYTARNKINIPTFMFADKPYNLTVDNELS